MPKILRYITQISYIEMLPFADIQKRMPKKQQDGSVLYEPSADSAEIIESLSEELRNAPNEEYIPIADYDPTFPCNVVFKNSLEQNVYVFADENQIHKRSEFKSPEENIQANIDDIMSETTNGYTIDVIKKSRFYQKIIFRTKGLKGAVLHGRSENEGTCFNVCFVCTHVFYYC